MASAVDPSVSRHLARKTAFERRRPDPLGVRDGDVDRRMRRRSRSATSVAAGRADHRRRHASRGFAAASSSSTCVSSVDDTTTRDADSPNSVAAIAMPRPRRPTPRIDRPQRRCRRCRSSTPRARRPAAVGAVVRRSHQRWSTPASTSSVCSALRRPDRAPAACPQIRPCTTLQVLAAAELAARCRRAARRRRPRA